MCFMFLTYLSVIVIKRCLQTCTVKTDIHRSMYIGNMLLNDTYIKTVFYYLYNHCITTK